MIDLIPTSEQQEIADAIASFLEGNLPVERLRAGRARSEAEEVIWAQLAELGCFGLSLPEESGGVGLTMAEDALAFREYGRYLLSPAILGTVLAAKIAVRAGLESLATELIAGNRRAGIGNLVLANTPAGRLQLFDVRAQDLVVVWNDESAQLFEANALGAVQKQTCIDGSLSMAVVDAPSVQPVAAISLKDEPIPLIAAVLLAAMLTGALEGVREMAVLQAQTRMQFGQPIGVFQAVKHKCADIGLASEAAWSQTIYAALTLVEKTADAPFSAWNAKMIAGGSALDAARTNIQLYGGMGFTAEVNAHLFLKRIHVLNEIGGNLRSLKSKVLTLPIVA